MLKVVFLDIDGVLNSMDYLHAWHGLQHSMPGFKTYTRFDEYGDAFDPRCVMNFETVLRKTDAKIVVSSTWRMMGLKKFRLMWEQRKLYGEILDVTGRSSDRIRGQEVQEWLGVYKPDEYVILDDDSDFLPEQMPHFVQTDGLFGLTWGDAKKAVEILKVDYD